MTQYPIPESFHHNIPSGLLKAQLPSKLKNWLHPLGELRKFTDMMEGLGNLIHLSKIKRKKPGTTGKADIPGRSVQCTRHKTGPYLDLWVGVGRFPENPKLGIVPEQLLELHDLAFSATAEGKKQT